MTEVAPTSGSKSINRRTVLAGAAWSVPVIAATVALPLAAASVLPVRTLLASSKVSVPPVGDPSWNTAQYGAGKDMIPYAPVVLGMSFTNLGEPLEAGEAYLHGLLASSAKDSTGVLYSLSAVNNNNWQLVAIGAPQHSSTTSDAIYPVWFRYLLPLATGQTSSTVTFTAVPTGAIADHIVKDGVVLIPSQTLWSRAYVNADLSTIPSGGTGVTTEYRAEWSDVPLPGRGTIYYIEPASA